jgi:uncharacterized membrane protein
MTASTPGGLSGTATGAEPTATSSQEPEHSGLEHAIARLLTIGTYASIGLLAAGVVLMAARGVGPLSGGPAFDPSRLLPDVAALRPEGFLWLGLVAVVATPAARVVASLVGFARRGERTMAAVAASILVVIVVSVALATAFEG